MPTFLLIVLCFVAAIGIGQWIGRRIPASHQTTDTKEAVKLSMGLVATMSALLLGLLVSSSKTSYDNARTEVVELAAKGEFADRVLALYGDEAAPVRAGLREMTVRMAEELSTESGILSMSSVQAGDAIFLALRDLRAKDDQQRGLKAVAEQQFIEIGEARTYMHAQSQARTPQVLLVIVVAWLFLVLVSFSVLSPPNLTSRIALVVSAVSAAGALLLVLELDRPFGGIIRVPLEPLSLGLGRESR